MPRLDNVLTREFRDVGMYDSNPVVVPASSTGVKLIMPRDSWPERMGRLPETEIVRMEIWFSPDGGSSWEFLRGCSAEGGERFDSMSILYAETTVAARLPGGSERLVRVRIQVREGFTCTCHLEFS